MSPMPPCCFGRSNTAPWRIKTSSLGHFLCQRGLHLSSERTFLSLILTAPLEMATEHINRAGLMEKFKDLEIEPVITEHPEVGKCNTYFSLATAKQ